MERKRVGIFVSVYHRINEFKRGLESLLTTDLSNHDVVIFIGFNGGYEEAKDFIKEKHYEIVENTPIKFHTIVPTVNIGKGKLINIMTNYCKNLDYVVTVDGDVYFPCINWLDFMIESYEAAKEKGLKIAALAPMIQGHDVHVFGQGCDIVDELSNKFHFVHRPDNSTAGPLFFIPIDVWREFKGYRGHRIYASDDGHFCYDATTHGYMVGMIPEIDIYHPFETNKDYTDWKWRAAKDELKKDEEEGYYEQNP